MSKKHDSRHRTTIQPSAGNAHAQLERMLLKQQYKDAVKQAKLIYKADATPENHKLLERSYFLRADQLYRTGMVASAVEVARHLLEYGVTEGTLIEDFSRLLIKLGMAQDAYRIQGRLESPEVQSRLAVLAADQAVLHPDRSRPSSPEIGRDAALVRQALEALAARDEAKAQGLVRDIARSSPLSEWKLFVRGLAAYYRHDTAEAQANWDRLDAERAPFRITQRLKSLDQRDSSGPAGGPDLAILEDAVFGERILHRLRELSDLASKQHWPDILRRIAPLRMSLRGVDPRLAEQLTRGLIGPLAVEAAERDYESGHRLVQDFTRVAEPLAIDPRWNRLWGLIWEGPQGDPAEAIDFWTKYAEDLKSVPGLTADERPLALALIWKHLAELYLEVVEDLSEDEDEPDFEYPGYDDEDEDDELDLDLGSAKQKAIECIEKSIHLAPRHRPTYDLLVEAYEEWKEPAKLDKAKRRILKVFPDDLGTLTNLALHHQQKNEPARALQFIEQARKLKPLDEDLKTLEATIRISLARCLALEKRWDEGRNQFELVERLDPSKLRDYSYLGRKAIFETKAGARDAADRYEKEALGLLVESTPLWLVFHMESIRYKLTKAMQNHYAELWKKDLRKKCRSETAGAMAAFLSPYVGAKIDYPGRDKHVKDLVGYIERTTRLKYRLGDLEEVCQFLVCVPDTPGILEKLIQKGLKDHPQSVLVQMMTGGIEMGKGPIRCRPTIAKGHLEKALKFAESSTRTNETSLIPKIKEMLSVISELTSGPMGLPFGAFGGLPFGKQGPGSIEDLLDFFNDEYFDEDEDEPFFEPGYSRAQPSGRKSQPKSKRRT
jgi:tetratricopeptide (TPR) repeat protein